MKNDLIKLIERWREDSKMWNQRSDEKRFSESAQERFYGYSSMLANCATELEELIKDSEKSPEKP